ncbi:MAK10-like protein, partial [Tanacetum coccineum]
DFITQRSGENYSREITLINFLAGFHVLDDIFLISKEGHRMMVALGWHLEEIHVTWAHLEKKRTRLRTCIKIHQEVLFLERGDGVAGIKRRRHDLFGDGVWILVMASQRSRLKVDLEPSTWRRSQKRQSIFSLCYLFRNPFSSTSIGDENHIRTLGDYSKSSHDGYRNTIELPVGNNVEPLRSDTIRLVQNGYSFHGLRFEDPNQYLKDFLKVVDSLDLDGANRERMRLCLFQFSLHDQASNWLERLPAGSITTWEDLTTRFLAQFFPPGRTVKLRNDILIRTIDQSVGGKLRDLNAKESWELLEDLALYDNESWNDPRDFAKPVKAIALSQDVPSISDRRLIELENQVQRLMEAHLAPIQPTQVNKVTTSCKICSDSHDTQYCMEDLEQAFVEYASSHTHEMGRSYRTKLEKSLVDFDFHHEKILSSLRTQRELQKDDMISKINLLWKTVSEKLDDAPISEAKEESSMEACKAEFMDHEMSEETKDVKSEEEAEEETEDEAEEEEKEGNPKHFDTFPTMNELKYHEWLLKNPWLPWVKAKIRTGNVNNVKFSYTTSVIDHYLGSVVFGKPFIEETGLMYNKEEGMVMLERDKERIFKMPHKMDMFKHIDFAERGTDCIPPFIIESDDDNCEKTHYSGSLDLGPEYKYDEYGCKGIRSLMSAKARRKNKGEVTLYLTRRILEVLRKFHLTTLGGRFNQLSHVSSPLLSKPEEY